MEHMEVNNSKAMLVLLSALGLKPLDYEVNNKIILKINTSELLYYILSSSEEVQNIYGYTDEWKELIQIIS